MLTNLSFLYLCPMLELHSYQLVSNEEFQNFYWEIRKTLPQKLIAKIEKFKFWEDRQRSLLGELIVRKFYREKLALEEFDLEYNEHNKPFLKGYHHEYFNISHSGNHVVVAFSDQNVGVDVEKMGKDRREIAERFFTVREIQQMHACPTQDSQIHFFYQLWTLKESYMKAIGKGMTMSLSSFSFLFNNQTAVLDFTDDDPDWNFYSELWKDSAYLSICSKSTDEVVRKELFLEDLS